MWTMDEESEPDIRKTVSLPASWWRAIEDFQFKSRIKKDSVVIRRIVQTGMDSLGIKPKGKR
jgi:hypothetical protein